MTISVRTSGASAGSHDRYLHAPDGTRLRSLPELARHLGLLQDAPAAVLQQEASHALGPSLSGRERRPVNRLVASEETELPQLAKKHLPASTLSGSKRDFVDPEEPLGGPRRRKLPNGAWEKLPPRCDTLQLCVDGAGHTRALFTLVSYDEKPFKFCWSCQRLGIVCQ